MLCRVLNHVCLARSGLRLLQDHWMPLANFARVSMISSLTHITYGLVYSVMSEQIVQYRHMWGTGRAAQ